MPFPERLALIRRGPDDCWLWEWAQTPRGYGHFRRDKLDVYAHRAAYELLVGPIPEGMELDHSCKRPPCCNPAHLTPRMPVVHRRRHDGERTHCIRGHPLLPERPDTWFRYGKRRRCAKCHAGLNAVRWHPEAALEYSELGRPSTLSLAEKRLAEAKLLQRVAAASREVQCENGHLRAEHGWKVFPGGFRQCQACYAAKLVRKNERRSLLRREKRKTLTLRSGDGPLAVT